MKTFDQFEVTLNEMNSAEGGTFCFGFNFSFSYSYCIPKITSYIPKTTCYTPTCPPPPTTCTTTCTPPTPVCLPSQVGTSGN